MLRLAASALYVALDGTAFALSSTGMMAACGIAAATIFADNPRHFSGTAARSAALVVVGRIGYSMFQMFRSPRGGSGSRSKMVDGPLTSIWDWQPPDSETAGIWIVLKELVSTFNEISVSYPEIKKLLESTVDLPQRLWYYISTDVDDLRARGEALGLGEEGSVLCEDDARGLALLQQYREYCLYSYDCKSDQQLETQLATGGFTLIGAKYVSDEYSPAFYLAYRTVQNVKETMLCLRGTYSGNDVVTDLIAAGTPFEEGYAHSGMVKSATYLSKRFADFLLGAAADGVLTICGHSLGAGVAALLTHSLASRQMNGSIVCTKENVRCLCYEPPACVNSSLASSALADAIYSLVNRDDLVPRLGPTPIINLLHELGQFDWRAAAERDSNGMVRRITMLLAGNGEETTHTRVQPRRAVRANDDWNYDPVVPGRIFFIAPGARPVRIDPFSDVLRTLKLTKSMVADHFIESDEFIQALSGAQLHG